MRVGLGGTVVAVRVAVGGGRVVDDAAAAGALVGAAESTTGVARGVWPAQAMASSPQHARTVRTRAHFTMACSRPKHAGPLHFLARANPSWRHSPGWGTLTPAPTKITGDVS